MITTCMHVPSCTDSTILISVIQYVYLLVNFNWHNMIIVCTIKHPKKTDVMAMMTPSLAPNWNDSV